MNAENLLLADYYVIKRDKGGAFSGLYSFELQLKCGSDFNEGEIVIKNRGFIASFSDRYRGNL